MKIFWKRKPKSEPQQSGRKAGPDTVLEGAASSVEPGKTVAAPGSDKTAVGAAAVAAAEAAVAAEWAEGDVILDLYEVAGLLGEGGMGKVYRVRHRGWNLDLAVKSPRRGLFRTEEQKQNFVRECETWIDLGLHPHTVSCYYVRTLGGIPRMFAEYVEGGSLADWIRSGKLYEGGPEAAIERILDVAIQFAWGLGYAHERGLIHQDVKPANVMLTAAGVAKVTDFGLAQARPVQQVEVPDGKGETALVRGRGMTPAYCSPEQAAGEKLSRKTDVWSWSVSVLEMFTGGVTWLAGQAASQVLESYLEAGQDDKRFPQMPQEVAELLRRCFERKPDERPQGMAAVAAQLRECYRGVVGEEYRRAEPKPSELLADALNNRAVSLLDLGRWEEAEKLFEQALQADAHHPEATCNRGLILWRSGRMTDDVLTKQLEEVRKTHEGDWRDEFYLGLVHMERGDEESALKALEQASGQAPQEEEVHRALAVVRRSKGEWHSWVRTLEGHTDKLASVAFSRDGCWVLSGSWDTTLWLWELAQGKCVRNFKGHAMWVDSVAFSPDGRWGLSGSWDKTLRLWELTTGKCVRIFEGHSNIVTSVSISPDGRWALSGSTDKTLRLWELATGRCVRTFTGHTDFVQSVNVSPDGRWALSGSDDKTLRLWELATGRYVRTFEGHTACVKSASISPDGRWALSGSDDKTLRLWELGTGRCVRTFQGHTAFVTSVGISPDGRWVLSGSEDKTVRLWELATGKCVRTFEGPKCEVTSVSISPDGRLALAGSGQLGGSAAQLLRLMSGLSGTGGTSGAGSALWLWELKRCGPPASFAVARPRSSAEVIRADTVVRQALESAKSALGQNDAPRAAAEVSHARRISGYERHKELMDLWHQTRLRGRPSCFSGGWLHRTFEGHSDEVQSVGISPDGRWALSGSTDKTLRLWELKTGRCVRTFKGHEDEVYSVAISPDGRMCLSGSKDKTLRLWDLATGQHVRTFQGHAFPVNCVSISPNGQWALSGGLDRSLRMWELGTGRCVRTFVGHEDPLLSAVLSVAISPDGRWGLSAKKSKETLRLWDLATGQCVRTFKGHTEFGTSVSFSPDGIWVLSGSADKTLRLWELATGKCVRTFEGHTSSVSSVCLSQDGRWALSASGDKTVRLWELATGRCVRAFEGHTNSVNSVSLSPDGRWLMSGSGDNTLRLWELDWECEFPAPADWDEGVRPHLKIFLTLHCPCGDDGISRVGTPRWNDPDFARLLTDLQYRGYGWLRSEGVRRELEKMTREWKPL